MAVRSKRLGQTNAAGAATANLYTCPTDSTTIVKELVVSASAATAPPYTVAWEASFSGGTFRRVGRAVIAAVGDVIREERWFVLSEGDVLRVNVPSGVTAFAMASGAELAGDSP